MHVFGTVRLVTALLAAVQVGATAADLPIVYSARYYYPPGSRAMSHFHLYLTDSRGRRRRQLTHGTSDDMDPEWSPDGHMILFDRDHGNGHMSIEVLDLAKLRCRSLWQYVEDWGQPLSHYFERHWKPGARQVAVERETYRSATERVTESSHFETWLVDARTGSKSKLPEEGKIAWSADGTRRYVHGNNGTDTIIRGTQRIPTATAIDDPMWLSKEIVAGVDPEMNSDRKLVLIGSDGRKRSEHTFKTLAAPTRLDPDTIGWRTWCRIPQSSQALICALNLAHDVEGTRRIWDYYRVDLARGKMEAIGEGKNISYSPDGREYTFVPGTQFGDYGNGKRVYVAPLEIRASGVGRVRQIVKGLIWVWSADWYRPPIRSRRATAPSRR